MANGSMTCPTHRVVLEHTATRWGGRWKCPVPGCTVVCWSGGTSTPADAETRAARHKCHELFDPLWKDTGGPFKGKACSRYKRVGAYKWLAGRLNIGFDKCHFGMFNKAMCERALVVIQAKLAEIKR